MDFMNVPDQDKLVIMLTASDTLAASHNFPSDAPDKYCFFIKLEPAVITMQNLREIVYFGDMVPKAIKGEAFLFENVSILCVICNCEGNSRGSCCKALLDSRKIFVHLCNKNFKICILKKYF